MIRFAWLQFRMQAAIAAGALAIVAVVLAVTGPSLVHLYDTTVAACGSQHACSDATTTFTDTDGPLQVFLDFLVLLGPLLIGMFWGAPLVSREFETGTFRLAWTQGVSRSRWLAVKLGLGALASMLAAGLLSLMVTWWSSDLDLVSADPFDPLGFGVRDLVPVGYAAFAFTLGAAAGLFFRRMLPAMLTALAGYAAVREIVTRWIRPYLFSPSRKSLPITAASPLSFKSGSTGITVYENTKGVSIPDAWIYSVKIADNAGHAPAASFLNRACPLGNYGPLNPRDCSARLAARFHQLVTFQPASRYWPLQWYELAIFLGLAAVLGGLCFWWIRRPVSGPGHLTSRHEPRPPASRARAVELTRLAPAIQSSRSGCHAASVRETIATAGGACRVQHAGAGLPGTWPAGPYPARHQGTVMNLFECEATFEADPDAVWKLWTDVARWPEWDVSKEIAQLDGPFEAGVRGWARQRGNLGGSFTITAVDALRRWVSECPVPLGKVVFEHTLEPVAGGRVRVVKRAEVLGGAAPLLLLFAPRMRRDTAESLAALGRQACHQ